MSDPQGDSVTVSIASQQGSSSGGTGGQRLDIRTLIKKSWSTVTISVMKALSAVLCSVLCSLGQIWGPFVCHLIAAILAKDCAEMCEKNISMRQLWGLRVALVPHMVLCLTMTFFLPISFLRKLILMKLTKKQILMKERILLVISCIALLVDPLFFYIPFIDEKSKCIGMDKKLRAVVLALRSLTDLAFAILIDAQIYDRVGGQYEDVVHRGLKWLSQDIIIEVLPILPIPQVIIVTIFFRVNGYKTAIGNVFLILQFIARGYQIYRFQKAFKMDGKWANSAFYSLIYFSVGHVLGAFWYFLSIQREISCWHQICRETGCLAINYCKNTNYLTNITLVDDFCPINPSNTTLFDFGVFLDALQSGNTGPTSFSTKYFYTLWWGIKNLSNFGTSLETSNYFWENCFTILISLVGLLLFLYLMGNVQTYILWETQKALDDREKKIESNNKALNSWMDRNGIPKDVKTKAVKIIKENKVMEKKYYADVDLVFVFEALTDKEDIKKDLKRHLCLDTLREADILKNDLQDSWSAHSAVERLKPVVYKDSVVEAEELEDRMLIILEGAMKTGERCFVKGEVYGGELLTDKAKKLAQDVTCETKVEAFALSREDALWLKDAAHRPMKVKSAEQSDGSNDLELAKQAYRELTSTRSNSSKQRRKINKWLLRNSVSDDLQTLVMEQIRAGTVLEKNLNAKVDVNYLFSFDLPWDIKYRIKKQICIDSLRKVPVLDGVDKDLLRAICMFLEPLVLTEHSSIFDPDSPMIDRMLIVVEGEITVSTETTRNPNRNRNRLAAFAEKGRDDVNRERIIKKGDVIGEELLTRLAPTASELSNSKPAILEKSVKCSTKVEAFALTEKDLKRALEQLEKGGISASRSTTTVDQRLDALQGMIRGEMANLGRRLDEMAAFLSKLGYPAGTPPPPAA